MTKIFTEGGRYAIIVLTDRSVNGGVMGQGLGMRDREMMKMDERMEHRRQEIISAAERVFGDHGYAATKMDDIASAAGISKGSVYNYFKSKEDLFEQVFMQYVSSVEAETERVIAGTTTATEKMEWVLAYWAEKIVTLHEIARLMMEFWAIAAREQPGRISETFSSIYAHWREILSSIITEGVKSGEFHPTFAPQIGSSLILAVMDGIRLQLAFDVGLKIDETFLAALKQAVLMGLTRSRQDGEVGS